MSAWRSALAFVHVLAFVACGAGRSATPSAKEVPAATAAAPAVAEQAADLPGDRRTEGLAGCRFERPQVWPGGAVSWIGNCRNGFAEDSGVIVMTVNGADSERFYGRVQGGRLSVGVLQSPNGFMAGTWTNGVLADALADDVAQRKAMIGAFRVAADAASAVSKTLAKKGDAKASQYYAMQAKALREQVD